MGKGTTVNYPEPTEDELAIQKMALDEMNKSAAMREQLMPYFMESLGYRENEEGELVKLTSEEYIETLDPATKLQYENNLLLQERQQQALKGELPVSAAMEKSLGEREAALERDLSQRLGPQWKQSSVGITAMDKMKTSSELMRDQARRGEILQMSGLTTPPQGGYQKAGLAQLSSPSSFLQNYPSMLQPYQSQRSGQFNAQQMNAQQRSQTLGGIGSLLGTAAGIGSFFLPGVGPAIGASILGGGASILGRGV